MPGNASQFDLNTMIDGEHLVATVIREWQHSRESYFVRLLIKIAGKEAIIEIPEPKLHECLRHIGLTD